MLDVEFLVNIAHLSIKICYIFIFKNILCLRFQPKHLLFVYKQNINEQTNLIFTNKILNTFNLPVQLLC